MNTARPRMTRIVATVGKLRGSSWPAFLGDLAQAGVDVFRLNMSHASPEKTTEREILDWIAARGLPDSGVRVAALGDLQGPKLRLGRLPGGQVDLPDGAEVVLRAGDESEDSAVLPLPAEVASAILTALGDELRARGGHPVTVVLGDGDVRLDITAANGREARAQVRSGGAARDRMGLTLRGVDVPVESFTPKDREDLDFLLDRDVPLVAVSFVRRAEDLRTVRRYIRQRLGADHPGPALVAKIETAEAVRNFRAILRETDAVMVARGDLGLQVDVEDVPQVQKRLVRDCRLAAKPVIIATQMLESMTWHPEPTRAEVADVFNAILDGCDAVMLSGETSRGEYPVEAVRMMARIARRAELWHGSVRSTPEAERFMLDLYEFYDRQEADSFHGLSDQIALAATELAEGVGARTIIVLTATGATARRLARFRSPALLGAGCRSERVARQLLLVRGAYPVVLSETPSGPLEEEAGLVARRLAAAGIVSPGEIVVVTGGRPPWPLGGTNVVALQAVPHDPRPGAGAP